MKLKDLVVALICGIGGYGAGLFAVVVGDILSHPAKATGRASILAVFTCALPIALGLMAFMASIMYRRHGRSGPRPS